MRIGLTYDAVADWRDAGLDAELLAEFDSEQTIAAIATHIARRGHAVERIGRAQALVAQLAQGARWDLVFNICEGLHGPGREALVPALLEAYDVPCVFSNSTTMGLCLDKGHAKRVVRDAGVPTADFAVIDRSGTRVELPFPVFAKPITEGSGKGISAASRCEAPADLAETATRLLAWFAQPILVERYLPGREFTVGVLGSGDAAEMVGVMEILSDAVYGFAVKKDYAGVRYRLAGDREGQRAGEVALAAWRVLGCRDAGRVDIKSDEDGCPMFLEVNPLAGLHPVDSDLVVLARLAGHDYAWLLEEILVRACARAGLPW